MWRRTGLTSPAMTPRRSSMEPDISPLDDHRPDTDRDGVVIHDPIDGVDFPVFTDTAVAVSEAAAFDTPAPVDATARLDAVRQVRIPRRTNVFVRDPVTFDKLATFSPGSSLSLSEGPHLLELNTAPVKTYVVTTDDFRVYLDRGDGQSEVVLEFARPTTVRLGVRSLHDQPAGTITTTDDPRDLMRAVSLFGSSLKTTSPERSFPTLRGHPPLVEVGDEFDAPDGIERPETGVRIEVPETLDAVFQVAPLAYYLGGEVVPGDQPRIATDTGFEYSLTARDSFEETVNRVLQQVFVLDCITRTEGLYAVDLAERKQVENRLDFDWAQLYNCSLAERLTRYLSVGFEAVADAVPEWPVTMDIVPEPASCPALPFAAADLALVRTPDMSPEPAKPMPDDLAGFNRGGAGQRLAPPAESEHDDDEEDVGDRSGGPSFAARRVTPKSAPYESVSRAWAGSGVPTDANKLLPAACQRRLQTEVEQSSITIHVVCNDPQMAAEGTVADVYGLRDLFCEYRVEFHSAQSTQDLQELFKSNADLVHYIGHVDDRGLKCPDGYLDARTLDDVNVRAFILNACQSYDQGEALVEAGSLAGVVTLSDIGNSTAVAVGQALARLLNAGFPLRAAVQIARQETNAGFRWMTVGDDRVALCESASACPFHLQVARCETGFETVFRAYASETHGIGSLLDVYCSEEQVMHLIPGSLTSVTLSEEDLKSVLQNESMPVEAGGELFWSREMSVSDVWD